MVPKDSKFRSVGEIIAFAKANPGKLTYASPGHGSSPHMSAELFKYMAKVDITHVPYRGAAPGYTDLIAGRIDMYFAVMASGLPLVEAGQLRALGVTTAKRQEPAPDVPTDRRNRRAGLRHVVLVRLRRAGEDPARDRPQDATPIPSPCSPSPRSRPGSTSSA